MTISDPSGPVPHALAQDAWSAVRYYLGSRTGMIAVAAVALGLGAYFNWGWLVAAGIAPLLIGVLPCVAMCALGLCMSRTTPRPASSEGEEAPNSELPAAQIVIAPQGSIETPALVGGKTKGKKECC